MGQAQQNRRTVLIVEDDAELREFVARLLEDSELDTIECESAEAALATMLIRGRGYPASRRYGWDRLGARGQDALAVSSCDSHVRTSARRPAAAWGRFYA